MKDKKPTVAIWTMTYNHAPYIRECLDGIVMQQTNFPFVAIVHDDCSLDGTIEIIKEYASKYPDIIKPIFEEENQYSKHNGSLDRIKQQSLTATGAKYIAICEGDDYWTDPLKLQKQVDFLESHPDYGMCYTRVKRYIQKKKKFIDVWGGYYETLEELLDKNTIPTLSVLFRHNLLKQYYYEIKPETQKWKMGDYPMWLYLSSCYNLKFLPDVTGVYRILGSSASHCNDIKEQLKFNLSFFEVSKYFAEKSKFESERYQAIIDWIEYQLLIFTNKSKRYIYNNQLFKLKNTKYYKYALFALLFPKNLIKAAIKFNITHSK